MDLKELGREGVEWIHMAQDGEGRGEFLAVVNAVIDIKVFVKLGDLLSSCAVYSFSGTPLDEASKRTGVYMILILAQDASQDSIVTLLKLDSPRGCLEGGRP